MRLAGIVAEFNPLHNGHKYIIDCAKNDGFAVACAISGNFVQRGDCAIIPKFRRALTAINMGVDIVCELPVPWSMSTAQNFALGGVSQLLSLGVSRIYFGSECGDIELLKTVADALLSDEFDNQIKENLNCGLTYAKLRQNVISNLLGNKSSNVLECPNDTLAVEYIFVAKKLGSKVDFKAIKRVGSGHNDETTDDIYSSSTFIRNKVKTQEIQCLDNFMPKESIDILLSSPIADINRIDKAIISRIKQISSLELSQVPDVSEGLENLILSRSKEEYSFNGLCEAVKSKRYTMARIRRILLCAYLGINKDYFLSEPPYVRILGFSKLGLDLLPKQSIKPIITRVSQINELNDYCKQLFNLEMKINELYALCLDKPQDFVSEYKEKLIK